MSTVNGFQVGSETLKYNYESLDNYNTPNFSTSSSKTYAVGDYVMYNGKLYKCTTATTGGTWVSGNWTLAVLSDDVSDLNRQLSDVEENQIPELKSVIYNCFATIQDANLFEKGTIYSNGQLGASNKKLRSKEIFLASEFPSAYALSGYKFDICAYTDLDVYVGQWNGTTFSTATNVPVESFDFTAHGYNKYKIIIRKTDGSNITLAEGSKIVFKYFTDVTLTQKGKAADGYITGNKIQSVKDSFDVSIQTIEDNFMMPVSWEQGAIAGDTGNNYDSNKDIRTGFIAKQGNYIIHPNGMYVYLLRYPADGSAVEDVFYPTSHKEAFTLSNGDTFRLRASALDSSDITPDDNTVQIEFMSDLDARITEIDPYNLPVYYAGDYIDEKLNAIREAVDVEKGASFIFITDLHLLDNSKSSKGLVRKVLDDTVINMVICGGDIPSVNYAGKKPTVKAEVLMQADMFSEWVNNWGKDRVFTIRGNHDYFELGNGEQDTWNAPQHTVYNYTVRAQENIVHATPNMCYYYVDNAVQKIRYIMLDPHTNTDYPTPIEAFDQTQASWFLDAVTGVDGYSLVVISHGPLDSSIPYYYECLAPAQAVLKALKNKSVLNYNSGGITLTHDFTNSTNDLVCSIFGHIHKDLSNVDDGVLAISTTSDAPYNQDANVTRLYQTISESAFDIYAIDINAKIVKTVRVGGGYNRIFHYNITEVHNSENVTSVLTDAPLTWSTGNSDIATVSDGVITAVGTGATEIIAIDSIGNSEHWVIKVN